MTGFVEIALPINNDNLYTYRVPTSWENINITGRRAIVQLGKRELTGIIIDYVNEPGMASIKEIIEVLDEKPLFNEKMLAFAKWIAEYYMSPLGEVFRAAIPPGMSPKSVLKVQVYRDKINDDVMSRLENSPKKLKVLKALIPRTHAVSVGFLQKETSLENISPQIEALNDMGLISCEYQTTSQSAPKFQKALSISDICLDEAQFAVILNELETKAPRQAQALSAIYLLYNSTAKPVLLTDLLKDSTNMSSAVAALIKKGLIIPIQLQVDRNASNDGTKFHEKDESRLELTEEQKKVLESLTSAMEKSGKKPMLLHGVTGSGKTLIYMHLIKSTIARGKNALLMVPEISLTPQLIDRFETVFPGLIRVIHSRMSQGERYDSWQSILNGQIRIVIGARSALFAPVENLGVIIVDEEHESSYKQDSPAPFYHARDSAIVRAKIEDALIVLGSATPSLESMYNALNGKYEYIQIKNRADGARLPEIATVNIVDARKNNMLLGNFSTELINLIAEKLVNHEGIILLQNRRGYSLQLECCDCGSIPMCKYCSVTLTYHKKSNLLRCHYCGYSIPAHKSCQVCGYAELSEIGSGTQKIEDELQNLLEERSLEAVINRVDLDSASKRGALKKILLDFAHGKTDILVGTQMVAKGLDFEKVTLVGVINADLQLYFPDFRASERTFQLLTQVAGRAGRKSSHPGKVIIQTRQPEHIAIESVILGSYESFYNNEIQSRLAANYPPYSRFCVIEFSGKDERKVDDASRKFADYLPHKNDVITKLGPTAPTISRIKSLFRRIIVLKNNKHTDPSGRKMRYIINVALSEYRRNHSSGSIRITIDIDSYKAV